MGAVSDDYERAVWHGRGAFINGKMAHDLRMVGSWYNGCVLVVLLKSAIER